MATHGLDSEYENGVADVLAAILGDQATVERNVHLQGRLSGRSRQIDIAVEGPVFGGGSMIMIVDCKRYAKPVDVKTVEEFIGLVSDVGADFGLLVTTEGISTAGRLRAQAERGIKLDLLPVDLLEQWMPQGTVTFEYAVPSELFVDAARAARRAGFRVRQTNVADDRELPTHQGLSAYRHFGVKSPSVGEQVSAREQLLRALTGAGVAEPVALGSGITIGGGTPAHRYLEVAVRGEPTGLKVLVASEEDIDKELLSVAEWVGLSRESLDVIRPDVWPVPLRFPNW